MDEIAAAQDRVWNSNRNGGSTKTKSNAKGTKKAATRVKNSRQTKVSETTESGREERVTRKLKNPNMCRVLNLDYFEVLSNYTVTTRLAAEEARLCLLVANPLTIGFDRATVRARRRVRGAA